MFVSTQTKLYQFTSKEGLTKVFQTTNPLFMTIAPQQTNPQLTPQSQLLISPHSSKHLFVGWYTNQNVAFAFLKDEPVKVLKLIQHQQPSDCAFTKFNLVLAYP